MIVALDPQTGSPRDAWLTEETRKALVNLSISRGEPIVQAEVKKDLLDLAKEGSHETSPTATPPMSDLEDFVDDVGSEPAQTRIHAMDIPTVSTGNPTLPLKEVEMPLIANAEFFRVLRQELARLDDLQVAEQRRVEREITNLGQELALMVQAGNKKSKTDVNIWRDILQLYVDTEIFFSARERTHGTRNSDAAAKQLELFAAEVQSKQKLGKMTKEGRAAFERFMQINNSLFQYLRFQELNHTALRKIMKKFDKRTALQAQAMLPPQYAEKPFIAQSLARTACFKISEDLLTIVPQLNDYLCPVCFNVAFKPIRLGCDHLFCIRCLIVMQRARQAHCPLCRSSTVMAASSGKFVFQPSRHYLLIMKLDNLDTKLMDFLKRTFPREVKLKQKENEHAAGVDQYGEDFDKAKCALM